LRWEEFEIALAETQNFVGYVVGSPRPGLIVPLYVLTAPPEHKSTTTLSVEFLLINYFFVLLI